MIKFYFGEWKGRDNIFAKIVGIYSGTGYCHSSMLCFDDTNGIDQWTHFELDAFAKPQYNIAPIDNMKKFIKDNNVDFFEIKGNWGTYQREAVFAWWFDKKKINYNFLKLATFVLLIPMRKFYEWYYKTTGQVFKPFLGNVIKNANVCSTAVMKCIKACLGVDIDIDIDEDCEFPGLYARYAKENKLAKLIIK